MSVVLVMAGLHLGQALHVHPSVETAFSGALNNAMITTLMHTMDALRLAQFNHATLIVLVMVGRLLGSTTRALRFVETAY